MRRGDSCVGLRSTHSFTLIELLVTMAIISILAAIAVVAAQGVMKHAALSRASTEVTAYVAALERYKLDQGAYPTNYITGPPYTGTALDPTSGAYQLSAQAVYLALSGGITNFTDYAGTSAATNISYYSFKATEVGNLTSGGSYIQDPFGFPYGYSIGTPAAPPYNGQGFFDLWSTAGLTTDPKPGVVYATNSWIKNW